MTREWKLRFMLPALVATMAAGCGDSTDPDNGLENFDAEVIASAPEAAFAPMEASSDAQFAIGDFFVNVLGTGAAFEPQGVALDRVMGDRQIRSTGVQPLLRQVEISAQGQIPPELFGTTFVWDPNSGEFGEWVADGSRTDAPDAGVRVMWYLTDAAGYVVPLQEQGFIDLTNATVAGVNGIRVQINRTVGGNAVLADFTQGYASTETDTNWTARYELEGFFGDGTNQVDVDLSLLDEGEFATFDEHYVWDLVFDGPEGLYTWQLDGNYDGAADEYADVYDISITQGSDVTTLAMELDGFEAQTGTGTLRFNGATVANIAISNFEFTFSKPGGGSFTSEEIASLEGLTYAMYIYGPLLVFSFLFFLLG